MSEFALFAEPWWVNLFVLVPVVTFCFWRKNGPEVALVTLGAAGCFGAAFGFVEAAVVIYLRAAVGLLPGHGGSLADVARLSSQTFQQPQALDKLPESLLAVEIYREAATLAMLVAVAFLSASGLRERAAIFLWCFALWDICYYIGLYLTVGWPPSLSSPDVLFLIPEPWLAQVWFPILVSALTLAAVLGVRKRES